MQSNQVNESEIKSNTLSNADGDTIWLDDTAEKPGTCEPQFTIDIDGFEGPLDLLLHLSRVQKVDILKISVLDLAKQYLDFVDRARKLRIELAADYLVMAAWLAFLKSKLLLPEQTEEDEPTGEEMAIHLAFRLKRLEAMREAGNRLMNRNRLGRDFFSRGESEQIFINKTNIYSASIYDLLSAYTAQRQRQSVSSVTFEKRRVWSLKDARVVLDRLLGDLSGWVQLDRYLDKYLTSSSEQVTAMASSFAAVLELAREGTLMLHQDKPFAPLYVKSGKQDKK